MSKKLYRFMQLSFSMILMTGCATTQTVQPVNKNSHIVIVSAVGETATYKLVATTVIQNTENQYRLNNFNVDHSIATVAKQHLENLGYKNVTIINLPEDNTLIQDHPLEGGWSTVNFKPTVAQYISSKLANKNADILLFFNRGGACPPLTECGVNAVYGFGVSKRSVLGISNTFSYAALSLDIFDAKTLTRIDNEDESEFEKLGCH
jgi:hypothetical protein